MLANVTFDPTMSAGVVGDGDLGAGGNRIFDGLIRPDFFRLGGSATCYEQSNYGE